MVDRNVDNILMGAESETSFFDYTGLAQRLEGWTVELSTIIDSSQSPDMMILDDIAAGLFVFTQSSSPIYIEITDIYNHIIKMQDMAPEPSLSAYQTLHLHLAFLLTKVNPYDMSKGGI